MVGFDGVGVDVFHDEGLLEADLEDHVGDFVADVFHELLEEAGALAFVLDARVFFGVTQEADGFAELVHGVEVVFPGGVVNLEEHGAFEFGEFVAEEGVAPFVEALARFLRRLAVEFIGGERDAEAAGDPCGELTGCRGVWRWRRRFRFRRFCWLPG